VGAAHDQCDPWCWRYGLAFKGSVSQAIGDHCDGILAAHANPALRLLPEWTQWCIEQSRLDGDAAAQSREAARSAAAGLVDEDDGPIPEDDTAPFRRPE
jgi:hypothetical protein